MNLNKRKVAIAAFAIVFTLFTNNAAVATATPEEAAQLGTDKLTEFGAETSGNSDRSIPAYTGGLTTPPASYKAGSIHYPDPFADEKPLYTVDSKNLEQYKNLVTPGVAALINKYPTFHLDVYPSHRTMAYPKWVLDNTKKNASAAELTGKIEGDGVKGAYGGIPFPVPKNGYEILWNFFLAWQGVYNTTINGASYLSDSTGHVSLLGIVTNDLALPYYDPTNKALKNDYWYFLKSTTFAPSAQAGTLSLSEHSINYSENDQLIYFYSIGQRRVRIAPENSYDTPVSEFGGVFLWDEIGMYNGRPDRFDFKIIGKKEMLVPYNDYKLSLPTTTVETVMTKNHIEPSVVRWEKHRVWEVEGDLKPGKRHVYSKRVFYFDEDTWQLVAADAYDHSNKLYRVSLTFPMTAYTPGNPTNYGLLSAYFNMTNGSWCLANWFGGADNRGFTVHEKLPNMGLYTPEALAGSGIR